MYQKLTSRLPIIFYLITSRDWDFKVDEENMKHINCISHYTECRGKNRLVQKLNQYSFFLLQSQLFTSTTYHFSPKVMLISSIYRC